MRAQGSQIAIKVAFEFTYNLLISPNIFSKSVSRKLWSLKRLWNFLKSWKFISWKSKNLIANSDPCLMIELEFELCIKNKVKVLKFIYSEKATKFCTISTVDLTGTTLDKSRLGQICGGEYAKFCGLLRMCSEIFCKVLKKPIW